jgi:putative redox protein
MQVTVKYAGVPYELETDARGHTSKTNAVDSLKNGSDKAQNPHERFLAALGECYAMTVLMYAQRKGWKVDSLEVTVKEGKIDDPAGSGKKIPHITMPMKIDAPTLTDDQVTKLIEIGGRCPVKELVMSAKVIEHDITRNP